MRGTHLIRRYISLDRLICFCVLDVLFCVALLGIALLLSVLIDTVTAAVASGDVWPVVYLTLVSCLYAMVLGVLRLVSGALKTMTVRDVMVDLREDAACGMMTAESYGRTTNSSEQLTILGQNMDTLESDCVMGVLDILESAFKIVIGCVRDAAQGAEVIRSFHVEKGMLDKMSRAIGQYQGRKAVLGMMTACIGSVSSAVGVIMQFAFMGMTGMGAVWGYMSIGSIIAVTQLSGSVISPATELSGKVAKLKSTYPLPDAPNESKGASEVGRIGAICEVRHSVELDDVSFSYGSANDALDGSAGMPKLLHDCSQRFDASRKFAITGASGCGKSTMLELLGGRLHPSLGRVLVDGDPYLVPDAAWVHQHVFLFDDTLRENITLREPFADEQVRDAVHLAGLDGVVASLPDGLDTPVHEGGARFSGGECQRVVIARALLYGKTTLLVDEATSALDGETAAHVEDTLLSLDGVTLIAVTHHLDSKHAARYDEVLEMSNGGLTPADRVA